jgi:hypothetical protein
MSQLTGLSVLGCTPKRDDDPEILSFDDWFKNFGTVSDKGRHKSYQSRRLCDGQFYGGALTGACPNFKGMGPNIYRRKGGGTNQFVAAGLKKPRSVDVPGDVFENCLNPGGRPAPYSTWRQDQRPATTQ